VTQEKTSAETSWRELVAGQGRSARPLGCSSRRLTSSRFGAWELGRRRWARELVAGWVSAIPKRQAPSQRWVSAISQRQEPTPEVGLGHPTTARTHPEVGLGHLTTARTHPEVGPCHATVASRHLGVTRSPFQGGSRCSRTCMVPLGRTGEPPYTGVGVTGFTAEALARAAARRCISSKRPKRSASRVCTRLESLRTAR